MVLTLASPPYKVITQSNKRTYDRHDCSIGAITLLEQRGVMREKTISIKNFSREGCCIAVQRTKDDMATGLSVGKVITVFIHIKNTRIGFQGTIKNVRKDNENDTIKYAGIEFGELSALASETVSLIISRLEQVSSKK